jgi:hypothetical protein
MAKRAILVEIGGGRRWCCSCSFLGELFDGTPRCWLFGELARSTSGREKRHTNCIRAEEARWAPHPKTAARVVRPKP